MKGLLINRFLLSVFILLSILGYVDGQVLTLKQVVIPTQGAHYRVGNTALSWTLGETAHSTMASGGIGLTQGEQQIERPLVMDTLPPKRACSDTTQQIVFRNVKAAKWASHVEWATNSNFLGGQIIRSNDSIVLAVDSASVDTVWLRSTVGIHGAKGLVTKTLASVLPNISVANKITVANDLCGMADTIHLMGPSYAGGYTYQWQSSIDGAIFIGIDSAASAEYYLTAQHSTGWFRRLLLLSSYCEKASNKIRIQ